MERFIVGLLLLNAVLAGEINEKICITPAVCFDGKNTTSEWIDVSSRTSHEDNTDLDEIREEITSLAIQNAVMKETIEELNSTIYAQRRMTGKLKERLQDLEQKMEEWENATSAESQEQTFAATTTAMPVTTNATEWETSVSTQNPEQTTAEVTTSTSVTRNPEEWENSTSTQNPEQTTAEANTSTPDFPETTVDLLFVLDGSGSVYGHFDTVKNWVKNITSQLKSQIESGDIHVGVVQYSHYFERKPWSEQKYVHTEIEIGEFRLHSDFENAVDKIKQHNYTTFTGHALEKVMGDFNSTETYGNQNNKQVMILITDGKSSDPELVPQNAEALRRMGVTSFVVGVANVDPEELGIIATGKNNSMEQVFIVQQFDQLYSLVEQLQNEILSFISQNECDDGIVYQRKCYFAIIHPKYDISFILKAQTCQNAGGRSAGILNSEHQTLIEDIVRKENVRTGFRHTTIWVDLVYNSTAGTLETPNGNTYPSTALRWYPRVIGTRSGSSMSLVVNVDSESPNTGVANMDTFRDTSVAARGVLCKK